MNPGCIISFHVKIGPQITLPTLTKICSAESIHKVFDKDKQKELVVNGKLKFNDYDVIGSQGDGVIWLDENEDEDEDEVFEECKVESLGN